MKSVLVAFSGLICWCLSTANVQATMVVDFAYMEASGTLARGFAVDSFSVASGAVNDALTASETLSLGPNGLRGKVGYSYNVGNTVSNSGSSYDLSVYASAKINASSNLATRGVSYESFLSVMDFTIDQDYVGTLDMSSLLSSTASPDFALLNANAFLASSLGSVYGLSTATTHTGDSYYLSNANFPIQINMAPGSYRLWIDLQGGREAVYNLPNLSMSGAVTLSLTPASAVAVPEPSSLALWACVALGGSSRLRRLILRRNENA